MAIEKEVAVVTKQVQVLVNEPTLEEERFEELLQTGESPTTVCFHIIRNLETMHD